MIQPQQLIGSVVDRFELTRFIGQAGAVFRFEATQVDDDAAVSYSKFGGGFSSNQSIAASRGVLHVFSGNESQTRAMFNAWREWRTSTDSMYLPCHLAKIVESGELKDCAIAFTEPADSLATLLNDDRLKVEELLDAFRCIAGSLSMIHDVGSVHGGLSAHQIFKVNYQWQLAMVPSATENPRDDIFALGALVAHGLMNRKVAQPASWGTGSKAASQLRSYLGESTGPYAALLKQCLDPQPGNRPEAETLAIDFRPFPEPVPELRLTRNETEFVVEWDPPEHIDVQLVAFDSPSHIQPGEWMLSSEAATRGEVLPAASPGRVEIPAPIDDTMRVAAISCGQVMAVASKPLTIGVLEDVTIRRIDVDRDELVIQLNWPGEIQNSLILLRHDQRPTGPGDRHAMKIEYPRGGRVGLPARIKIPPWHRAHVTAYAFQNNNGRTVYAAAEAPGCHREVDIEGNARFTYKLTRHLALPFMQSDDFDLTISNDHSIVSPEFVLVGRSGALPPAQRSDGEVLAMVPAGAVPAGESHTTEWRGLNRPFAVRLFAANEKDAQAVQLRLDSKQVFYD